MTPCHLCGHPIGEHRKLALTSGSTLRCFHGVCGCGSVGGTDEPPVAAESDRRRFVERPREFEAVQFTGTPESCSEVTDFLGGPGDEGHVWDLTTTDGGWLRVLKGHPERWTRTDRFNPGDWIIRYPGDSLRVMRDDVFHRLFEEVEPNG